MKGKRKFAFYSVLAFGVCFSLLSTSCKKSQSSVDPVDPDEPASPDYSGTGDYDDPFIIENADQLAKFRDDYNSGEFGELYVCAKLNADIDLEGEEWSPIGSVDVPFNGVFNGNNHTISNFKVSPVKETIDGDSIVSGGFFSAIYSADVMNLTLDKVDLNISVSGKNSYAYLGGISGVAYDSTLVNVDVNFVDSTIISLQNESSQLSVGGAAGYVVNYSESENSVAIVSTIGIEVSGNLTFDLTDAGDDVQTVLGGVIGIASNPNYYAVYSITNSSFKGNLKGGDFVGGILAYSDYYVSVVNSFSKGESLEATNTDGSYVGGIIGTAYYMSAAVECFSSYDSIVAANSTGYYESYADIILGIAYEGEAGYRETYDAVSISSLGKVGSISADNVNNSEAVDSSVKEMAESCNFNTSVWDLSGDTPFIKEDVSFNDNVSVTLKANDGVSEDVIVDVTSNFFAYDVYTKLMDDEFTKEGYSFFGYCYDEEGNDLVPWYVPYTHDTTLYGGYASISNLLGSYSVNYTYYDTSNSAGTWTITEDQFIWILADNCVSYYSYSFDGENIYLVSYEGNEVLAGNLGGYVDEILIFDGENSSISLTDINDSDCVYLGSKSSSTIMPSDYSSLGITGDWVDSKGESLHFDKDGNYYGYYTSSYTGNTLLAFGGYSVTGNAVVINYSGIISKTNALYDATEDVIYNASGVVLSREAITKVYKSADSSVSISVSGEKTYTIASGVLTSFSGTLADGEIIVIGEDSYEVSGEVLSLIEDMPTTTPDYVGTWKGSVGFNSSVILVLNEDGTGSYGDTSFTYTVSGNTLSASTDAFTLTMVYDESAGTLKVTYYDENEYTDYEGTLSKETVEEPDTPSTEVAGYVGTWKGSVGFNSSVVLVLNEDGTGSYGDTSFTYTVSGNTLSASTDAFTLTMVYDESAGTLKVTYYDEDEYIDYEGTLSKETVEEPDTPSTEVAGYVGTWKGSVGFNSSVVLVLNEDGTGSYGDTSFTYTVSGTTLSASTDAFTLTMVYDESAGTLKVTYYDEDEYTEYEGTLSKAN